METALTKTAWKHWGAALLVIWIGYSLPVQAQVQQAARTLVPKFLNQTFKPLSSDKEADLVVTAAGASTDVLVIANPSVPPQKLIQALQSAVAATPLQSQPIEWSAPTSRTQWIAVHTSRSQGHFGSWQATNRIPIGAFWDGLHQAGFTANPVLHIPDVAFCAPLPVPFADFSGYSWYDLETMRSRDFYQVRTTVSPTDFIPLLFPFLLIPAVGFAGQAFAARWARGRERTRDNRKRFDNISNIPTVVGWMAWMLWTASSLGSLTQLYAINDVWLGRAGTGDLFSAWFVLVLMIVGLTFWNGQRVATRLYGPEGVVPITAMSTQERSLREREALWSAAIPVLMCSAALALVLGGRSLLPSWLPPATFGLLPLVLLIPLGLYFQKRRKSFTTLVPDASLTDQVRQIVSTPGLPPVEVVVEQNGRAATYASLDNAGSGQIVVSQKLLEVAAPDQLTFLLVSQSVLGRTRDWSKIISLLTVLVVLGGMIGVSQLAPRHYFAASLSLLLLLIVLMLVSVIATTRYTERRLIAADREAVRLTNNRGAAREALELMRGNAAPPEGSRGGQGQAILRLTKRIAALKEESATAVSGR